MKFITVTFVSLLSFASLTLSAPTPVPEASVDTTYRVGANACTWVKGKRDEDACRLETRDAAPAADVDSTYRVGANACTWVKGKRAC